MSTIKVQNIQHTASSTNAISLASDGTCSANITNNLSNRRLTINGDMRISQRATSWSTPADNTKIIDRYAVFKNGAGEIDIEQSTTVPTGEGFKNSLKCTVDTADTSLSSSDFGGIMHKIEGQDITQFDFGNSSAKQFTLSFFVRSNITGTYSVAFRNGSANRYLVKEYTISSADTWQKITITDTADLTGTWASDNTTGIDIRWCLWEGGFTAAPNTWGTGNILGSTNNVNWAATVGNTFYITGIQLELGSISTDYEFRGIAQELALCQRYYVVIAHQPASAQKSVCNLGQYSPSTAHGVVHFPVQMRVGPSLAATSGGSYYVAYGSNAGQGFDAFGLQKVTTLCAEISTSVARTQGDSIFVRTNAAGARLAFEAEL